MSAFSARRTVGKRRKTIDRPRKNLCDGRLARAARSRENVRMPDAVGCDLVFESAHDMVLSDDFVKGVGTIFAI